MKRQVLGMFVEQLAPDGALFVGHSENVRDAAEGLAPVTIPQAFCLRPARGAAGMAA